MQKIRITFPTVSSGVITRVFEVDESIGLNAGRDLYATARGTAKKIAKSINPCRWVWVQLSVDEYKVRMSIENGKWTTELI